MLSFAPAPAPIITGTWDHRPSVSSPLSSSPIRASSPLSPTDDEGPSHRQTQSSPIRQPKFRYASRPARQNPLMRKREDAQEIRRRNFLENVRHKAEDKAWQRRDIEGQFLKNSLLADIGRLSYDAPTLSNSDLDDAMAFQDRRHTNLDHEMLDDDDECYCPDDSELESMVTSCDVFQSRQEPRPPSPDLSDEEYDDIFAELIAREQTQSRPPSAEGMDVS
ncbi:hypothetical protein AAL_03613 [Moelleriella libera RCEF 2490]|uniref:Uncharacterized protein n=1 Tax=Moelleriella libera RCEF 2490 TaxID=1081109 RepID=A0A168DEC6_9HYPO|nr:hypothetical protein AAL_03613 [Moelleriella libera RCEF 2490]